MFKLICKAGLFIILITAAFSSQSEIILKGSVSQIKHDDAEQLPDAAKKAVNVEDEQATKIKGERKRVKHKDAQLIAQLTEQSVTGDSDAAFQLAVIYYQGQITPVDPEQAYQYFQQAADQGHLMASLGAGYLLCQGLGVTKNTNKARYYLLSPKNEGYPRAYFLLSLLEAGIKTPQADIKSRQLLQQAASMGDAPAANAMGNLHLKQKNFESASRWYQEAISLGSHSAKQNITFIPGLGKQPREQFLMPEKPLKTIQLSQRQQLTLEKIKQLQQASENHQAAASYELAVAFHKGIGVPVNFSRSFFYYRRAAQQGSAPAKKMLSLIMSRSTAARPIDEKWMLELSQSMDTPAIQPAIESAPDTLPVLSDDPLANLIKQNPHAPSFKIHEDSYNE